MIFCICKALQVDQVCFFTEVVNEMRKIESVNEK